MKAVRIIAPPVIVLAALYGIYQFCWRPLRANRAVPKLIRATTSAYDQSMEIWRVAKARRALGDIQLALRDDPTNLDLLMLAGATHLLLGQPWAARDVYTRALRYDNRPEILIRLAVAEASANEKSAAERHAVAALQFNPSYLDSVEDPMMRTQFHDLLQREYILRGNLVSNATMNEGVKIGDERVFAGIGSGGPTAATGWFHVNGTAGKTVTSRVSVPGVAEPVLHVVASSGFSGVLQIWGPVGTGPSHVTSSVRLLVKKGRVMVSTGRLGFGQNDAHSSATGWQTIKGTNSDCPVNHIRIVSFEDGADFYIANVDVRAQPGAQCDNPLTP